VGARLPLPTQPEGLWAQLYKQALGWVSKRSTPLHKLPRAYNLALAAYIHRGGFAAPEVPLEAHMGRVLP
jgi:hypothetical protein